MTTTQKIQKLEHVWIVDARWQEFQIEQVTGFISPDGPVIPIGDRQHSVYMEQFKEEIGMGEDVYFKAYGAIRIRPGRVFIFSDFPFNSLNVEIHKKPTTEQLKTLSKIKSKVFYQFWGDEFINCPKDGVTAKRFMKDLRDYWKI